VINGTAHVLGSDKHAIERAVKQAIASPQRPHLPVRVAVADGKINVDIAAAKAPMLASAEPAEVWLCPLKKQVPVQIGRGENRGQTVTYTNVVRGWIKLGEWNGDELRLSKPLSEIRADGGFDAVSVLVQAGRAEAPGHVYGAATASLK